MYRLCPIMFLATVQLLVLVFFVCLFAYLLTTSSLCACTLFLLHDDNSLCMSRLQCFAMLSHCLCRCCYCLIIFPAIFLWIVIYPLVSIFQPLNDWDLKSVRMSFAL